MLFVPRVIDLVNSSSSYSYNAQQQTYLQPDIARDLLAAFHSVNKKVLGRVKSRDVVVLDTQELPAGTPLDRVASAALAPQVSAPARQTALEQVLLSAAHQTEVPVLVAVDDVQALFGPSWYRDPDFAPLQSYELAVPRALLSILLAAPKDAGIQRGAVLSAVSTMHSEFPPTPELLVALRDATGPAWKQVLRSFTSPTSPTRVQEPHAYTPMDEQHLINARTARFQPMDVGRKLMRSEAASLLELLHREHASWNGTCRFTPRPHLLTAQCPTTKCSWPSSWRATAIFACLSAVFVIRSCSLAARSGGPRELRTCTAHWLRARVRDIGNYACALADV